MSWKSKFRKLDMFRKVPTDLTESSTCGTFLTILCYITVAALIGFEFSNYLTVETKTDYMIEQHNDEYIRINFDITMTKLSCEYATLDVVNQMGTHKINVTQNIRRWQVYSNGFSREITPVEQMLELSSAEKMRTELYSTMIKGMKDFERVLSSKQVILVNFFAPWCHWCQELAPIYEGVAQRIQNRPADQYVTVAKVDCTAAENQQVCRLNNIQAFPTLIVFTPQSENKWLHYHGPRTVEAIERFVEDRIESGKELTEVAVGDVAAEQEGCRLQGSIIVPRMSGNFHISCHGPQASILPAEINVSHKVNSLVFGDDLTPFEMSQVPETVKRGMNVLKDREYPVTTTNTSYEHILKVFPTKLVRGGDTIDTFQYTSDSGKGMSDEDIPEATFSFEFDPLTIVMTEVKKPFYHFITSLFAIIGGVVTVISLIDSIFNKAELIFAEKEVLGKNE
ncbi:hypothetical protein WA538_006017 [Blastocystis sp. DL]